MPLPGIRGARATSTKAWPRRTSSSRTPLRCRDNTRLTWSPTPASSGSTTRGGYRSGPLARWSTYLTKWYSASNDWLFPPLPCHADTQSSQSKPLALEGEACNLGPNLTAIVHDSPQLLLSQVLRTIESVKVFHLDGIPGASGVNLGFACLHLW